MKYPTWKVLEWMDEPEEKGEPIPLDCPHCEREALMPCSAWKDAAIIGAFGLSVILDPPIRPPENWLPGKVRCRSCRKGFEKMREWDGARKVKVA